MDKQEVGFEVLKIEKARKEGFVVVIVKFKDNNTEYKYIRMLRRNTVMIDGCKIFVDENLNVRGIKRKYETQGNQMLTSSSKIHDKIYGDMQNSNVKVDILDEDEEDPEPEEEFEEEVKHPRYNEIKTCLECGIPVYLVGPAGSGKNYTVEEIAKENGWNFYFSNSVQQEYKLTGFIDAGGKFHETEFYKACTDENECVFFLDEMDASIPEVLILLNAAIANGYFEFPNGRVNLDNVHFVAAGNTLGNGADEMYTGRMVIDQATLDRFAIIEFDYSEDIELSITKGNKELVQFVRELRKSAKNNGMRTTFSYRCLMMVTKLEVTGLDLKKIITIAVVKGLDKDTIQTLSCHTGFGSCNKYIDAFNEIKRAV